MYREVTSSDLRVVVHKSAALAAQNFMLSMSSSGYDTCPMEGFDSVRVKKILNLPSSAEINMIIGCGIRSKRAFIQSSLEFLSRKFILRSKRM